MIRNLGIQHFAILASISAFNLIHFGHYIIVVRYSYMCSRKTIWKRFIAYIGIRTSSVVLYSRFKWMMGSFGFKMIFEYSCCSNELVRKTVDIL